MPVTVASSVYTLADDKAMHVAPQATRRLLAAGRHYAKPNARPHGCYPCGKAFKDNDIWVAQRGRSIQRLSAPKVDRSLPSRFVHFLWRVRTTALTAAVFSAFADAGERRTRRCPGWIEGHGC